MSILDTLNPYVAVIKLATVVAILATVAGVSAYKMHEHDKVAYDKLNAEYITFKIGVATLGEAAKKQNAIIALNNLKAKERADEENKRTSDALHRTIVQLRHDRDNARGSLVPPAPADSVHPDVVCFDRVELESALRGLVTDVRGLVDEGSQATVDLDTAKMWAREAHLKMSTTLKGATP